MERTSVDLDKVTPMMKQYLDIKKQYEDVIIFFRLGDFYEMFFEDAKIASSVLDLVLTGKNAGLDNKIPMCGIPHHSSEVYINKLIEQGYKVGICEQLEDAKNVKGIVKRDVIQVISKGTSIDSLNNTSNNYLVVINIIDHVACLIFCDVSTGQISSKIVLNDEYEILNEILSNDVKEVVYQNVDNFNLINNLRNKHQIMVTKYKYQDYVKKYEYVYEDVKDQRIIETLDYLFSYLINTQKRELFHLQKVNLMSKSNHLYLDVHTKKNLELRETIRLQNKKYSLFGILNKTNTSLGARKLRNMIENPLLDYNIISQRQDVIESLITNFLDHHYLNEMLKTISDLERLIGKISFGTITPKEINLLKNSIKNFSEINIVLDKIKFNQKLKDTSKLYELLESSINDEAPVNVKDGNVIKSKYNDELDELRLLKYDAKKFIAKFELSEREKTNIKNLKVGYNRVFGYYIEISKGNVDLIKDEYGYERRQTLSNCERYISPILKEKESLILNAEDEIILLEQSIFDDIKEQSKEYIGILQENANIIALIDALSSLAIVATDNKYVRPKMNKEKSVYIKEGRHPVIEIASDNEFIPNDIVFDKETNILLITGPNMAGKSTYLRQMALITIMHQMGSFVPATEAVLPIFDAIYTRIGASDDLVSGESTFMVEMIEARNAVVNATSDSLILFDELGRGTATFDGIAIAQSILEYIDSEIKCKTMFSTHYHELVDLDQSLKSLKNMHVSAIEENKELIFIHEVKEGSVDKSYGIHVAALAKLPKRIISRANDVLEVYEKKEKVRNYKIQEQLVFEEKSDLNEVLEELKKLKPLEMTPLEAIDVLYKLHNKSKEQ